MGASNSTEAAKKFEAWLSKYLWHWETGCVGGIEAAELITVVAKSVFAADPQEVERFLPDPSSLFPLHGNQLEKMQQAALYESLIRSQTSGSAIGH